MDDTIAPMATTIDHEQLAQELVETARTDGVSLVGPGGLLTGLTKSVLETALEAEMAEHLGYDKHGPAGRDGGNSRNGTGPRGCSLRSGRCRSRCLGTGTARSSR